MKRVIVNNRKGYTTSIIPSSDGKFSVWFDDNKSTPEFIEKDLVEFIASNLKVFKFYSDDYYWGISGETEEQAKEHLFEIIGKTQINNVEEIPEEKWDEKTINMWEDNDMDNEPYQVSIRECMENEPILIFTNDLDF